RREFELLRRSGRRDLPGRLRQLVEELGTLLEVMANEPRARIEQAIANNAGASIDLDLDVGVGAARAATHLHALLDEADVYCAAGHYLVTVPATAEARALRSWVLGQFVEQAEGRPPMSWSDWEAEHGIEAGGADLATHWS